MYYHNKFTDYHLLFAYNFQNVSQFKLYDITIDTRNFKIREATFLQEHDLDVNNNEHYVTYYQKDLVQSAEFTFNGGDAFIIGINKPISKIYLDALFLRRHWSGNSLSINTSSPLSAQRYSFYNKIANIDSLDLMRVYTFTDSGGSELQQCITYDTTTGGGVPGWIGWENPKDLKMFNVQNQFNIDRSDGNLNNSNFPNGLNVGQSNNEGNRTFRNLFDNNQLDYREKKRSEKYWYFICYRKNDGALPVDLCSCVNGLGVLFCNNESLRQIEPNLIDDWDVYWFNSSKSPFLPKNEKNFMRYCIEATEQVTQYLSERIGLINNKNKYVDHALPIDKWDVVDIDRIEKPTAYLAISNIYKNASTHDGDSYASKSRMYFSKYLSGINKSLIGIDLNEDARVTNEEYDKLELRLAR